CMANTTLSSGTIYHSRVLIRCSSSERGGQQRSNAAVRVNGAAHRATLQVGAALETSINETLAELSAPLLAPATDGRERSRQNIPTEKQAEDPFRQAQIVEGGVRYQQTVVVRSYEVGPDRTATLETILNLLQETALNHVWMSGLLGDGFGATHGMIKSNLIWVVSRMHVQVDHYPLCTWVMMNKNTRRLSKMPEEVRGEISPWFIDRHAIHEEATEKIIKLDSNAKHVDSDLKTIPDQFLQHHQLSSIILEYRKECGSSDVVQSICQPDEYSVSPSENVSMVRGPSLLPEVINGHHSLAGALQQWPTKYTHLLQLKAGEGYEEIVRGRTTWKKKL
uniref:Acyl-[acyl-carrier-protein] hydrolase n=1 Tax=Aegilops tauschii subsp. strangulata TaxID=200361 RepID=A0A453DFF5_AEGTS